MKRPTPEIRQELSVNSVQYQQLGVYTRKAKMRCLVLPNNKVLMVVNNPSEQALRFYKETYDAVVMEVEGELTFTPDIDSFKRNAFIEDDSWKWEEFDNDGN